EIASGTSLQTGPLVQPLAGAIQVTGGQGVSGTLTLVGGSPSGSITVNNVNVPAAVITGGGSLAIAPGAGVTPATVTAHNVTGPLSLVSNLGALPPLTTLNLLALPSLQAVLRSSTEISRNMSTVLQINESTRNPGGAASYTLTPPRTSLAFE